jgi:hypothetical protein
MFPHTLRHLTPGLCPTQLARSATQWDKIQNAQG